MEKKETMITFLCWNVGRKNLESNVINIVKSHNVDIVILLESGINPFSFLNNLKIQCFNFYENKSKRYFTKTFRFTI